MAKIDEAYLDELKRQWNYFKEMHDDAIAKGDDEKANEANDYCWRISMDIYKKFGIENYKGEK